MLRRSTSSSDGDARNTGSVMMTEANIKRLVAKLSQMRGAALKLGQFMSIQGQSQIYFRLVEDVNYPYNS